MTDPATHGDPTQHNALITMALDAIRKAGGNPAITQPHADTNPTQPQSSADYSAQSPTQSHHHTSSQPHSPRSTPASNQHHAPRRGSSLSRKKNNLRPTRADGRPVIYYRDPQPVGSILQQEIKHRGWKNTIAVHRLMHEWESIVGPNIAKHTQPIKFDEKRHQLHIQCDSTPWTTQLRLMQTTILSHIATQVGGGVVAELIIHAPNFGPRRHGKLRVQGRGARDDFG